MNFNAAVAGFRTIAADQASPWIVVSRYLIARALIREASLPGNQLNDSCGAPAKHASTKSQLQSSLAQARKELMAMREDPRMISMQNDIDNLLDYVNLRRQAAQRMLVRR